MMGRMGGEEGRSGALLSGRGRGGGRRREWGDGNRVEGIASAAAPTTAANSNNDNRKRAKRAKKRS